jgi:uncharacterized membrane protein
MMPREFREYAELWQDQIEPRELARVQAMAKTIERTARRKRLLEFSLGSGFIGLVCALFWIRPISPALRSVFLLLVALTIGALWRRHEITKASRATDIADPGVFFEKAIKNARVELRLSTIGLWFLPPILVFCHFLMSAVHDFRGVELIRWELNDEHFARTTILVAAWVMFIAYFMRDNIRLRQQLRRLERMHREWDEPPASDPESGA